MARRYDGCPRPSAVTPSGGVASAAHVLPMMQASPRGPVASSRSVSRHQGSPLREHHHHCGVSGHESWRDGTGVHAVRLPTRGHLQPTISPINLDSSDAVRGSHSGCHLLQHRLSKKAPPGAEQLRSTLPLAGRRACGLLRAVDCARGKQAVLLTDDRAALDCLLQGSLHIARTADRSAHPRAGATGLRAPGHRPTCARRAGH